MHNENRSPAARAPHAPLLRMAKRKDVSRGGAVGVRTLSIVLALLTGSIFLLLMGDNPLHVYAKMLVGSVGNKNTALTTVKSAIPLVIASLGVCLAFKMKFWNIGAEGQMLIGATAATYFALFHSDWPQIWLLTAMFVASFAAAGLWGMIPAFFKVRFRTNETLFTLMMNYVALNLITALKGGAWRDPTAHGFNQIAQFAASARLPRVGGVHAGWIIALALAAIVYVYMKHSKGGYELAVVGESENTARYAGMNVRAIVLRTMLLSAGICGIAGMVQASGATGTLTETVSGGAGFTAIIIAWLSQLSPIAVVAVSFLFSMMERGGAFIQQAFKIPATAANILEGIILLFVLGGEFFIHYKLIPGRRARHG